MKDGKSKFYYESIQLYLKKFFFFLFQNSFTAKLCLGSGTLAVVTLIYYLIRSKRSKSVVEDTAKRGTYDHALTAYPLNSIK